jgi:hypothetical protein
VGLAHANAVEGDLDDRLHPLPGFFNNQTNSLPLPRDEAETDAQNPESAIYNLIYKDATNSWGHRHGLLGISGQEAGDDHCTQWVGVGYGPSPGLTKKNALPQESWQSVYVIDTVGNEQDPTWTPKELPGTVGGLHWFSRLINVYYGAQSTLNINLSFPIDVMGLQAVGKVTIYPSTNGATL